MVWRTSAFAFVSIFSYSLKLRRVMHMRPEERFGYVQGMPEDIQILFWELCDEVAHLRLKWDFYLELFGNRENAILLADLARASYRLLDEMLSDAITMSVCRLSDSPSTGRYENLTLQALTKKCSSIPDLDELWKRFRDACEPFREHRNKRISHDDLNTATKPCETRLPVIDQSQVEDVLSQAEEVLRTVHGHYSGG